MRIPTWVIMRKLPLEFRAIGWEIVSNLGELVGFDKGSIQKSKQRFCVPLDVREGWETMLVVKNDATRESAFVLVDYLLIRCRFYLNPTHWIKDCPTLADTKQRTWKKVGQEVGGKQVQGGRAGANNGKGMSPKGGEGRKNLGTTPREPILHCTVEGDHSSDKEVVRDKGKNKGMVEEDGFTVVVNKKKTKLDKKGRLELVWELVIKLRELAKTRYQEGGNLVKRGSSRKPRQSFSENHAKQGGGDEEQHVTSDSRGGSNTNANNEGDQILDS
jgi:hypothetical protein